MVTATHYMEFHMTAILFVPYQICAKVACFFFLKSVHTAEVGCGYMDWIGLAQDRDRWRTLVSAVMNLRVP